MFEMYWTFNGIKINETMTGSQSGQLELPLVLNETTAGRYQCVVQDGLFSIVSEVAELSQYGKNDLVFMRELFWRNHILRVKYLWLPL